MRRRNCRVEVCFTKEELSDLKKKAQKAGLSVGEFVRRAVRNLEVKEAPPADIPILIRDIRRAGHNVNQLLKIADATHLLDAPQMRKVLAQTYLAADAVVKAYTMED